MGTDGIWEKRTQSEYRVLRGIQISLIKSTSLQTNCLQHTFPPYTKIKKGKKHKMNLLRGRKKTRRCAGNRNKFRSVLAWRTQLIAK